MQTDSHDETHNMSSDMAVGEVKCVLFFLNQHVLLKRVDFDRVKQKTVGRSLSDVLDYVKCRQNC